MEKFTLNKPKLIGTVILCMAVLLVAVIALPNFIGHTSLVIYDMDTEKEIASFKFEDEDKPEFAISFIHSVNQSMVKEGYIVKNGDEIYLDTCLYKNFGAGVATEVVPPQTLEILDNGYMLISGFDMYIPRLSYIVGTISDHILYINNNEISLRDLCGKNRSIGFKIKKII